MLSTTENALERLVALVGEHPDLNGAQVLDLWAEELTRERQKREARRTALADEALYYVARVEEVPVYFEAIGESMPRDVKVEKMTMMQKHLPRFCKDRGIALPDLMDVLSFKRKEVVDFWGQRWQANHPRSMYVDRSAQDEERAEATRDDEKMKEAMAKRAASRAASSAPVVTKEYR